MAAIGHGWHIHWSITCFLREIGSCLSWSISLFFSKTAPRCSDSGIYSFFSGVFKVCGLSEVFEFCHFFNFFADLLSMSSLSAWFVMYFVFPLCIFKPIFRLSELKLFGCFSICFVVSLKRATSSVNLMSVHMLVKCL